jgi:hypothetical protein
MSFYIHGNLNDSTEVSLLPKELKHDCLGLWGMAGSWAAWQLTGGVVTEDALVRRLMAPKELADELVRVELWENHPSGYAFRGATAAYAVVNMNSPRRPKEYVILKFCKLPSKAFVDWHARRGASRFRRIDDNVRAEVVRAHGMVCWLCSRPIASKSELHLDHVIPHSLSGPETVENLRPAHARCNVIRGNRSADEFRRLTALYQTASDEVLS